MRAQFSGVVPDDTTYAEIRALLPARYIALERIPANLIATILTDQDLDAAEQLTCTDYATAHMFTVQFLPDV